ncbi:thiol reductant ABC exporter subunit CydC [Priestia endophytica]|uniref:thiol reductant ABC exporter subunit CydC n=1 Tax=Priestia endophytica TaxID=135735 RepID=UPI0027E1B192|nr:thiol reductant ABC exporter subunit CydC [Priestia endophytica]
MKKSSWIMPYIQKYKYRMIGIMLLSMLSIGSAAALMFTSGFLISKSSLRPENILLVYVPIVLVRTFGLGRAVFRYSERLVSHDFILRVLAKMRTRLYHLVEPRIAGNKQLKTGEILGVLAEDIEGLQDLYLRTVLPTASALLLYIISIIALGYFSVPFALLMALYFFMLIIVMPIFSLVHMRAVNRTYKHEKDRMYQYTTDGLLGISDWLMSGQKGTFLERVLRIGRKVDEADRKTKRWQYYREFIAQVVVAAMIVTMMIFSSNLFSHGELANIYIAAFVLVVIPLSEAIIPVSNAVEKYPRYEESLTRITNLENKLESSKENRLKQVVYNRSKENVTIDLKNLSFQYEEQEGAVLKDINLHIPQGKKIAIIGRSGAGKSTLLQAIQGLLVPKGGAVTLNEYNASSIKDGTSSLISVLNQNPYLFNTNVANNLLLANENATEEEVKEVVKKVRLENLVSSLQDGYQTSMEETGQRFSGGERQRIALARVLLQKTPIVMLDEPTVGLDPITERALLDTIFETLDGKTLLWVTHHLTGIEKMDEIIFLEDGRVKMRGTHDELLKTSSYYQKLYELDKPIQFV